MAKRVPVKTALVGLLVAPAAMAQQDTAQTPASPSADPSQTQPANPSAAPATMQTVTVTGSRPSEDFQVTKGSINRLGAANLMDVPQSVVVINRALMQSQGVTRLEDAVRNAPGVTIGSAEGGNIGTNININGFSARTDIYLDGMRDRGQYYRDVFALEQVEVLMGPSSMLFGRGSTGGIINQVTKKPFLKQATELSAQATTNGLVRTTADVNTPFQENNAARVSAMFQVGKASTVDQTNVLDFGLAPTVKLGIGTPTEITLGAILQHRKDQVNYGVPNLNGFPLNAPRNTAYGFNDDYTEQDVIALQSLVEHKISPNMNIRNQTEFVWVNTAVRETSGGFVGTLGNGNRFVAASNLTGNTPYSGQPLGNLWIRQLSRDRNINDITVENQTEVLSKFETGPVGHTLLMGIDLNYESYTNQQMSRTGTCFGNALPSGSVGCTPAGYTVGANTPGNVATVLGNYASSSAWGAGFYANDTIQLLPELKVVAGLRWDYYAAQIANSVNRNNTAGSTTVAGLQQTDTFLSVRGGIIYEPTPAQSYYVSYSTSFNPSLEQLTSTTGTQNLPPENNKGVEAGVKYELFGSNLSLNGAVFSIIKNNARTANPDGTFSPTGNVQVSGARAGFAGRITPEWQVFGGYAYLNGVIIQGLNYQNGQGNTTGKVPLNTPRDTANLWTTYTFKETYEIGGGFFYVGQRYANNTNTVVVPAYTRVDLTAAYKQPAYDVRLNVYNLFNTVYYDGVIASDGGRAVVGSGLTGMITLNYRL
ncbi:TonB-dependent siderophore receptor [Reyranella aquatilis]|uniref:TonB-dependent siderophore receptor n=1 Tax=Reyranella aquatilis TaxID=2035356 RepID=A0ABS8KPR3_9HYPH|nr:TonB-dependent siderophore receptor [Reyranella aquatilis]MCC8427668.1 TonB-dependent siderophore receptor [Reyranella aquatilis]